MGSQDMGPLTATGTYIVICSGPGGRSSQSVTVTVEGARRTASLEESGPVQVTEDGQVIEDLRITSTNGPGIVVKKHSDVVIRNVEIRHAGGPGIDFSSAPNLLIEDVSIVHTGAPVSGPNSSPNLINIQGAFSPNVVIRRVRLTRGSAGIYLLESDDAHLSFIEGYDFRGPFPRGQLVQFNKSDNCVLEDFSSSNPADTSWSEDNVSVYQSSNCVVRRGLVDGNNSPSGVGIMVEQSNGINSNALVEDVDAVQQGNGCFSAYPGRSVTFRRTRCGANICTDQGRGVPLSGGLAWAGGPGSWGLRIEDSSYFALCDGTVWDRSRFLVIELEEKNFEPRKPIRNKFSWE